MKVIDAQGTRRRTTSTLDLFDGVDIPRSMARKINDKVGEFIVTKIKEELNSAKSQVSGESFPTLSPDYKKKKLSMGASGIPDLLLTGDMSDALSYKATDVLEIGFFNTKEAWKADGHLKFSGEENGIPKRRFLPDVTQTFKRNITSEIKDIIVQELIDADRQDLINELGL